MFVEEPSESNFDSLWNKQLDTRPVRKGDTHREIVEDLLASAEAAVHVDNVLMDREFDSQHILEMLSQRGLYYVVPERMQTSEKAQAKRLLKKGTDRYETDRKLHLDDNEWLVDGRGRGTHGSHRRRSETIRHNQERRHTIRA